MSQDSSNSRTSSQTRKGRVLLCATGSLQAQVVPRLAYNLMIHPEVGGKDVVLVATEPALQFFEREEAERVMGRKVFVHHSDSTEEFEVPHIHLAEWADIIVVYPACANTIAKCALGLCDSLVANVIMSARCPIFFGPVMNQAMFDHPSTQKNLATLKNHGYHLIPQEYVATYTKSTGQVTEKLYCSESMVLHVCHEYLANGIILTQKDIEELKAALDQED